MNKNMPSKRDITKALMGISIFFVFVSILLCALSVKNLSVAYADYEDNMSIDDICRQYTNSEIPNGTSLNDYLNDYNSAIQDNQYALFYNYVKVDLSKGTVFDKNVQYRTNGTYVEGLISGDDEIVKLIPKELFTRDNETLFVGKCYGFYIKTKNHNSTVIKE